MDSSGATMLLGGEHIQYSEMEQAIKEVQVGSLVSQRIAAGKTTDGAMFFVIKDDAQNILAKSPLYHERVAFDDALHKVKDSACIAELVSTY